ncbi:pyridoxal-phosphate dependent enzyme [Spirosoma sp. HMF4905]|uniref:Pyridoxal-phosphate dependent enzyme n=1 Tax=Spirosoma arboris TaxID=2682092 RepID=A0A7K1SG90_9BACT|nr:pyridoxal-phosphate dependent enzyme [Spirosoma arboris]MVM32763.1 pyridoxal-phosphate dependent enzyme [Spirosoma arboris]
MIRDFAEHLQTFPADSPLQVLDNPFPEPVNIRLVLKRDDLLHPLVSGNKWRKLKYNLLAAREQGFTTLLTFGGAYSNHLSATASAGQAFGFQTIGVVRGEELATMPLNRTLAFCKSCGMHLHFVNRAEYRCKEDPDFLAYLVHQFGPCYRLPEGGTNELAIEGTAEIIPEIVEQLGYVPDYVCCPVGTGGTVAGLAQSAPAETSILGFMALKGIDWANLQPGPSGFAARQAEVLPKLIQDYHFGGYAKTTPELIQFIRSFEQKTGVFIEQIYTGKMLYGIYDLARKGFFQDEATVVAVHTGGLQGRSTMLDTINQ